MRYIFCSVHFPEFILSGNLNCYFLISQIKKHRHLLNNSSRANRNACMHVGLNRKKIPPINKKFAKEVVIKKFKKTDEVVSCYY